MTDNPVPEQCHDYCPEIGQCAGVRGHMGMHFRLVRWEPEYEAFAEMSIPKRLLHLQDDHGIDSVEEIGEKYLDYRHRCHHEETGDYLLPITHWHDRDAAG